MPESITDDDAQYAFDIVGAICTEVGPGLPGTRQERERAGMIQRELESHLGAGSVAVEEFTFAPSAFLRSSPIIALGMLLAAPPNLSGAAVECVEAHSRVGPQWRRVGNTNSRISEGNP